MHFVTYRLVGTIPQSVLYQWRRDREANIDRARNNGDTLPHAREIAHKQFFAAYDDYLDRHANICWLANEAVAQVVRENLHHHNGKKYHLLTYCIMPNHVHVLLRPLNDDTPTRPDDWHGDEISDGDSPLSSVMHSLKSYTANVANRLLERTGQFWQHESYDHWIRDEDELDKVVAYINLNPVKAGLVPKPYLWKFGSACDRYALDGGESGMLFRPT